MSIQLYEHYEHIENNLEIEKQLYFKKDKDCPVFCYEYRKNEDEIPYCVLKANYYIGIDKLNNEKVLFISPKINARLLERVQQQLEKEAIDDSEVANEKYELLNKEEASSLPEINVMKLLLEVINLPGASTEINKLIDVRWDDEEIEIEHLQQDFLSPFLIVQFVNLMKFIVRKGLKKSYYFVDENLDSKIKGKILVNQTIKQNVFKNRLTKNYCRYQEFGYNSVENRFLKKVLQFVKHFVYNNHVLFSSMEKEKKSLENMLNYIESYFVMIEPLEDVREIKNIKHNQFYKEYKEAIKIGELILRNFSYSITKSSQSKKKTPPYWIDMSRLFELYVYKKLLENKDFKEIKYHLRTYGNELDFIGYYNDKRTVEDKPVVIDAKYKLNYETSKDHQDMHQVAGYARLNRVYNHFKSTIDNDKIIDCLIVYPTLNDNEFEIHPISAYRNIYKMGVKLPLNSN